MPTLNLYSLTQAVADIPASESPQLRYVDWNRKIQGISVSNPSSLPAVIQPGEERIVFDGTRSTSIDGTTTFNVTLSTLAPDVYRVAFASGTDPVFRTARAVSTAGISLALAVQSNGILTVTAASSTPFSAVVTGDEVMISGLMTGDASSPFSVINQGRWVVLGASSTVLQLTRPAGQVFQGISETIVPASDSQLFAYSQLGVQIGDKVDLSTGFSAPTQDTYTVSAVTSKYIEFGSTLPLPGQTGVVPTAAGMKFYTGGKRWCRIEVDQRAVIKINGDTTDHLRLTPWVAGDPTQVAEYCHAGPIWSLHILNRSSLVLNATVITVE